MIGCWAKLETCGIPTVWLMEPVETHSPGLGVEEGGEGWLQTHLLLGKAENVINGTTHSAGQQILKAKQIPKSHQTVSLGPVQ